MDFSTVIQAIGSLGFPIVACCALYYANLKSEEQHKEEQENIVEALNNNTIALTKLSERIGGSSNEN